MVGCVFESLCSGICVEMLRGSFCGGISVQENSAQISLCDNLWVGMSMQEFHCRNFHVGASVWRSLCRSLCAEISKCELLLTT